MQGNKRKALSFVWKVSKSLQIIVVSFLRGHLKKNSPGQISLLSSIKISKPEGKTCVNIYTHYKHLFDISL